MIEVEKTPNTGVATLPLGLTTFVKAMRGYEILEEIVTIGGKEELLFIPAKYKPLLKKGRSYKVTIRPYKGSFAIFALEKHIPRMVISNVYLQNNELRVLIDDKVTFSYGGERPAKSALRDLKQLIKESPNSFLGWGISKQERVNRIEVIAGFIKQVRLGYLHVENIIDPDKLNSRFKEFALLKNKLIKSL